jgi:malate dehydrogenase (oxaloacetate-decarboxylating)
MNPMGNHLSPEQILNDPLLNKGTAFTQEERDLLGLNGFLPSHVATLEEQVARRYENFQHIPDELAKYTFLSSLQNRNEILFYRLVQEHLSEMVPLIYTPTVGDVSLHFSLLYRQHRGIYFSYPQRHKIGEILSRLSHRELDVVVATDGERILGLGDVGIGGMAISQGKLALYTLFGGIHPSRTLPVMLDVGTNNPQLLNDPLYLGWRHPRVTGGEYLAFVDQFVHEIKKRFPHVLLQWEDFAKPHANLLLQRYRHQVCSFNDDIQGTAAVTLGAILSACKAMREKLKDQKIAILGGGSAGLGIANLIVHAMMEEGLTEEQARRNFYIVDIHGLLHTGLAHLEEEQRNFAHPLSALRSWKVSDPQKIPLIDVIHHVKPHVLIGVSTQKGAFTEEIVKAMAKLTPRPMIFPLSNPTSRSEAQPEDLIRWSQGKAIVATGSPFAPVSYDGKQFMITQCNNVSIFPGLGLGAVACRSPQVTERMIIRSARVLSEHSPLAKDPHAMLFPPLEELREVSRAIAIGIVDTAQQEGLIPTSTPLEKERMVDQTMWFPHYPSLGRR